MTVPVLLFAYANPSDDRERLDDLSELPYEIRRIREALRPARERGVCQIEVRAHATLDDILDVVLDEHPGQVALFHYAGHADDFGLLLESKSRSMARSGIAGLARCLVDESALQIVFLNACGTHKHVSHLLDAGVDVVVATSTAIADQMACEFAERFYKSLAGGASIERAFQTTERRILAHEQYEFWNAGAAVEDPTRTPWALHVRPGAQRSLQWTLSEASADPLFGVPPPPERDLPPSPYRYLDAFGPEHAEVFFGRGSAIRELHDVVVSPSTAPIVLLYGPSGVGKSSLLSAGVLPRLAPEQDILLRRTESSSLLDMWVSADVANIDVPLFVFDQLETALTDPATPDELNEFCETLSKVFRDRSTRPACKVILSFRTEWLQAVRDGLADQRLAYVEVPLSRLDADGVREVVLGPTSTERLKLHYRLEVEEDLAGVIASDLMKDPESPVAPTLQIVLSKLWEEVSNQPTRRFTTDAFHAAARRGVLLVDFFDEQLAAVRGSDDVGLALDIAYHHTAPGGAATRSRAKTLERYEHVKEDAARVLRELDERHLLSTTASGPDGPSYRLAHDTLAPIVRRRYEESNLQGQRAHRILTAWTREEKQGTLDAHDLGVVQAGRKGMRAWTQGERDLVSKSVREAARRRRRRLIIMASLGAMFIAAVIASLVALDFASDAEVAKEVAEQERTRATIRRLAAEGRVVGGLEGLRLATVAYHLNKTHRGDAAREVDASLRSLLSSPLRQEISIPSLYFKPSMPRVSPDQKYLIWEEGGHDPSFVVIGGVREGHVEVIDSFQCDSPEGFGFSGDSKSAIIHFDHERIRWPIGSPKEEAQRYALPSNLGTLHSTADGVPRLALDQGGILREYDPARKQWDVLRKDFAGMDVDLAASGEVVVAARAEDGGHLSVFVGLRRGSGWHWLGGSAPSAAVDHALAWIAPDEAHVVVAGGVHEGESYAAIARVDAGKIEFVGHLAGKSHTPEAYDGVHFSDDGRFVALEASESRIGELERSAHLDMIDLSALPKEERLLEAAHDFERFVLPARALSQTTFRQGVLISHVVRRTVWGNSYRPLTWIPGSGNDFLFSDPDDATAARTTHPIVRRPLPAGVDSVLFVERRRHRLFRVRPDPGGGTYWPSPPGNGDARSLAWSPKRGVAAWTVDGRLFAWQPGQAHATRLLNSNRRGRGPGARSDSRTKSVRRIAFHPSEEWMVVETGWHGLNSLLRYDLQGSSKTLVEEADLRGRPMFVGSGSALLLVEQVQNEVRLSVADARTGQRDAWSWAMDADSTTYAVVPHPHRRAAHVFITFDEKKDTVVYLDFDARTARSSDTHITSDEAFGARYDPDGKRVWFDRGQAGFVVRAADSGWRTDEVIPVGPPTRRTEFVVAPNGRQIGFAGEAGVGFFTLPKYGEPALLEFGGDGASKLAVSSSGEWILAAVDGGAVVFRTTLGLFQRAGELVQHNLSKAEWSNRVGKTIPYEKVFDHLPIPPDEPGTSSPNSTSR